MQEMKEKGSPYAENMYIFIYAMLKEAPKKYVKTTKNRRIKMCKTEKNGGG